VKDRFSLGQAKMNSITNRFTGSSQKRAPGERCISYMGSEKPLYIEALFNNSHNERSKDHE